MKNNKISLIKARKKQYQDLQKAVLTKPLIAVYDDVVEKNGKTTRIGKTKLICYYIEKNGGIPLLVPRDCNLEEVAKYIDGFALPGGMAVNPKFYNRLKHPQTKFDEQKEDKRFLWEETFVRNAVKENKPVLAICRGMHAGNVILGRIWQEENPDKKLGERGTLIQYIPEKFPDDGEHRDSNAYNFKPKDTVVWQEKVDNGNKNCPHPFEVSHDIKIIADTKLSQIVKKEQIGCFSWHNQGIGEENLAPQLTPCAYSVKKDGSTNYNLVEAAEYKNILMIQSHPETGVGGIAHLLFKNLVNNAKEYMKTKNNNRKINIDAILPYYENASLVAAKIREEANTAPSFNFIKSAQNQR